MDHFSLDSVDYLLRKRKKLRRELLENPHLRPVRIAVLGGTTTGELVDLLELLLLSEGLTPTFYQSEYNRFYEDAVLQPEQIKSFRPDLVYIHTHYRNVSQLPSVACSETEFQDFLHSELTRFQQIWSSLEANVGCQMVQNNFEQPPFPTLGNLDAVVYGGQTRYFAELNLQFAKAASSSRKLLIQDLHSLAGYVGLKHWFDWPRWFSYKILTTPEANLEIAKSLAGMIGVLMGRTKKCLVLDLDNTLWGGVIGDDGPDKIQIGKETAVAEAYTAFQQYCLKLRERGILLAVCSKNNEEIAREGFAHPDSILKPEHFSAFRINWEPKHENIKAIAEELNLGLDSFVFIDDNPAERAIVAAQLPSVAVPDIGSEIALYPSIIQSFRYFEAVSLSKEDLLRAETYTANVARALQKSKFANYGEYLDSLQMVAEIEPLRPVYLERATQLINKSNQFNLTTRRYPFAEVERVSLSPDFIALYGKLTDTFGDNGLVSVVIGRLHSEDVHLDLWIMSCRVLKRDMELAMLDALARHARKASAKRILGYYSRTPKNAMVEDHYAKLGFELLSAAEDGSASMWSLDVLSYTPRNTHIQVKQQSLDSTTGPEAQEALLTTN